MNQNEITYGTCTQILISWLRYVHKSGKDLFFKLQVEVPVTSTPPPTPPLFCPPRKHWSEHRCDWLEISLYCDVILSHFKIKCSKEPPATRC